MSATTATFLSGVLLGVPVGVAIGALALLLVSAMGRP
jgi:hypothetical protein